MVHLPNLPIQILERALIGLARSATRYFDPWSLTTILSICAPARENVIDAKKTEAPARELVVVSVRHTGMPDLMERIATIIAKGRHGL